MRVSRGKSGQAMSRVYLLDHIDVLCMRELPARHVEDTEHLVRSVVPHAAFCGVHKVCYVPSLTTLAHRMSRLGRQHPEPSQQAAGQSAQKREKYDAQLIFIHRVVLRVPVAHPDN